MDGSFHVVDVRFSKTFTINIGDNESQTTASLYAALGDTNGYSGAQFDADLDFSDNIVYAGSVLGSTRDQGLTLESVTVPGYEFAFDPAHTQLTAMASNWDAIPPYGVTYNYAVPYPDPSTRAAVFPPGAAATAKIKGGSDVGGQPTEALVDLDLAPAAGGSTWDVGFTAVSDYRDSEGQLHPNVILRRTTPTDTTAPVLSLPGDLNAEATSSNGAAVTYQVSANDAVDGPVPVTCDHNSGDTFPLGDTTVTCTATDKAGNTATGTFKVTVADTTAPVLSLPGDQAAAATSGSGAAVTYPAPTANDAVDGPVPVTCDHNSGDTFPLGDTTVTCTATDKAGNKATGTFKVTVHFQWKGFLQPINDPAAQAGQPASVFKAGSTVPVKFQLTAPDGTLLQAPTTPEWVTPAKGGAMSLSVDETLYTDAATTGTSFRWDPDAQQYIYNWKTTRDMAGYYWRIGVSLPDGTTHYVTIGLR